MNAPKERVESNIKTTMSFRERMQAGRSDASPTPTQEENHSEEQDEDNSFSPGSR